MEAHAAPTPGHRNVAQSWTRLVDTGTYVAGIASIYIAYGLLWFYAFKEKLFDQDGHMPAGLAKAYDGTIIDSFPGVDATWVILGVLDLLAFLAFAASLLTGEFLPRKAKPILLSGLAFSMLVFAIMTFGQSIVSNYDGVAGLFTYMGVTAIFYALLRTVSLFNGGRPAD